jgi:hypothetical protein
MSPDVEQLVAEYVQRQNTEAAEGYSTKNLATSIQNVADGLSAHIKECREHRESEAAFKATTHERLDRIEAGRTKSLVPAPLPPMRSREDSSHDLRAFASATTVAAIEGLKRQDTTPEAMVAQVVAQEQAKRDLTRLQAEESQRTKDAEDRRVFRRKLAVAALSGGGVLATLFEAIRGAWPHN